MRKSLVKLPTHINVHIQKGESGAIVATLEKFNAVTEADNLIELFFNVNDLIYTIFDVPKSIQTKIQYIPSKESQMQMLKIAEGQPKKVEDQFQINRFIRDCDPRITTL